MDTSSSEDDYASLIQAIADNVMTGANNSLNLISDFDLSNKIDPSNQTNCL